MDPVISVLLPVRDAAQTLATALRSIARQTETRWECVVVDDGSQDASPQIARAFAAQDSRFSVLERPAEGLLGALSTGLARCVGRYVARLDADDWMHRERLDLQRHALDAEAGWAAVGCHVRISPRNRLTPGRRTYERWLNGISSSAAVRREAFVECPVAHPSLMIRRERLEAYGYRDRGWAEDYDLVLRILTAGEEIGVVPRRLLGWRDSEGRLSRTHPRYSNEQFTACKAHFLCQGLLAEHEHYGLWGYGGTGRALRRALAQHGRVPSHIVEVHPGRLGQQIHGAKVISPAQLTDAPRLPLVASVAGETARARIRSALAGIGYAEGVDFLCAA